MRSTPRISVLIAGFGLFASLVSVIGITTAQASVVTITSGSSNTASGSDTSALTISTNCNSGDVIMVLASNNTYSGTATTNNVASVTSNGGLAWSQLVPGLSFSSPVANPVETQYSNTSEKLYYAVANATTKVSITVTLTSAADSFSIAVASFGGLANKSPLDVSGAYNKGVGPTISASVNPTAGAPTVTFMMATAPGAPAYYYPGTGYLQGEFESTTNESSAYCNGFLEYGTAASSGTTVTPIANWYTDPSSPQSGETLWYARAFTLKLAS